VIALQLQELKGEVIAVKGEVAGMRGEMRQLEKRMEEDFTQLNRRIDEALNIRERLAALEAKLAAMTN